MNRVDLDVRDAPEHSRYEGRLDGEVVAFLDYGRRHDGVLLLTHAEVAPPHGGRGMGTAFVTRALDDLRARGEKVQPVCGFVRAVMRDHPEYGSIVA